MQDLFRSRRRKLGLATLVLSLILTGGWIRSFGIADVVEFQGEVFGNQKARFALISARRGLYWQEIEDQMFPLSFVEWNTVDADGFDAQRDSYCDLKWHLDCLGFHAEEGNFGSSHTGRSGHIRIWIVPYWQIVIPFTMVSAYLLLSPSSWKNKAVPVPQIEPMP